MVECLTDDEAMSAGMGTDKHFHRNTPAFALLDYKFRSVGNAIPKGQQEPLEKVMVVYDDMDTNIGKIRVRAKGGPGSHNGMKSMVYELKSENFPRIRVGIGKPKNEFDRIDYVIGRIPNEEYIVLQEGENLAVDAVEHWIENGIDNTMNVYNTK